MAFSSCKDKSENKKYLPPSTGGINSLIVVMESNLWQGEVGDKVREIFADRVLAVPQSEAIFTITQIPPQVFSGAVSHSRSVLYIQQDTLAIGHVKSNVYAVPQKVAVVKGRNNEELLFNLEKIGQSAVTAFKNNEISQAQRRFKRSLNDQTDLNDEFGIYLDVPSVYHVGKHVDNFVWLYRKHSCYQNKRK